MKSRSNILLIILFVAGTIIYSSCKKPEQYPVIPAIAFVDFTKIDNGTGVDQKGILKFSFTDGDGDLGLSEADTLPPFNFGGPNYNDLFITYYEKQNGEYVAVPLPDSTMTNDSRIPTVTPDGENKSIKGNIEVELFINNPISTHDTIAYDVYIVDRALNKSNVFRTPDIVIHK